MAESLQAAALEELNQLAEDLKDQVGGAAADLMEDAQEAGALRLISSAGAEAKSVQISGLEVTARRSLQRAVGAQLDVLTAG